MISKTISNKHTIRKGRRFGYLKILDPQPIKHKGRNKWRCLCDCGNEHIVFTCHLTGGKITSCGCRSKRSKHDFLNTRTYGSWRSMKNRCKNKSHVQYHNYGGRGIKVCERWNYFPNFLSDMGECPGPEYSIERINNDGNYEPSNCKWATTKEQSRNKHNLSMLTYNNETKLLIEWAEIYNINSENLRVRLRNGWTAQDALETPIRKKN